MKVARGVRQFAIRFGLSLLLVTLLYGAFLVLRPEPKPVAATTPEKLAGLRATLNQVYLAGTSLSTFNQSNAAAFQALDDSRLQFETATNSLADALQQAPAPVSPALRQSIVTSLTAARQATADYKVSYALLGRIVSYDPQVDLGSTDLSRDATVVAGRATAAQQALLKAANDQSTIVTGSNGLSVQATDGPALLVNEITRSALRAAASCFEDLNRQLTADQLSVAASTRARCTQDYPTVRLLAASNITGNAWSTRYQTQAQASTPALLRQLDVLIKTAR